MDAYTTETKAWLDERFRKTSDTGIYWAHQPIYGYRQYYFDLSFISRYIPNLRIMKALSRLKFRTLLDVGAAEGYKTWIAQELFHIDVQTSDLSSEACKRAEEIFHLKATPADTHHLPYADNQFDVSLCSMSLEHVTDCNAATDELLRVAEKAVVIVVPHEDPQVIERNVREQEPHGHIRTFDLTSYDYLKARGYEVIPAKMMSQSLLNLASYIEYPHQKQYHKESRWPKFAYSTYNGLMRSVYMVFRRRTMTFLVALDGLVSRLKSDYTGVIFIILKDKSCYGKRSRRVSAAQVMKFKVPYYYLNK